MKKWIVSLCLLFLVLGFAIGEENGSSVCNSVQIGSDNLFKGVSGNELSSSEMEKEKGGIALIVVIGGFLTAYKAGALAYRFVTGRNYTHDLRRGAIRTYRRASRGLARAQDRNWRKRTCGPSW